MELFSVFVETILTLSCCLCRLHSHAPFFFHFGLCISDPRKACFCSLWNHWNRSTVNSIWNSNLHLLQNELSWHCTVALKFHKSKSRAQGQEVFDKTIWIDMKIMTFHSQIYCFMEKKKKHWRRSSGTSLLVLTECQLVVDFLVRFWEWTQSSYLSHS